jgi:TRAP-type C4-dicarboxylate transport system substrate-binding protein
MKRNSFWSLSGRLACVVLVFLFMSMVGSHSAMAQQKVLKGVSYLVMSDKELSMVAYKMFMDRVNERVKGELKIDYLGGPEVIPPGEQMTALSKGVVQLLLTPGYHTSIVPEVDATLVAEINPLEQRTSGFYDLMVKIHRDKLGVVPLARADYGTPFYLFTTVKVEKLKDFAGLKFRSNANYNSFFAKLGIVPVAMAIGELYTALERNLVVGYPLPAFISQIGLQTVTKNVVDHGWWAGGAMYIYVNGKAWDGLSKQAQEAIIEVSKSVERDMIPVVDQFLGKERKTLMDAGVKYVKLTPPDGDNLVKMATEVKWEDILKKSPEYGPKLKEMVKKK